MRSFHYFDEFPNAKSAILKFCDLSVIFLLGMAENYNLTCPR